MERFTEWTLWKFVVAFATMIGAFGGFPQPPRSFQWLASWQVFQWFVVFVLLYQGGTGEDAILAALITLLTYTFYQVVIFIENAIITAEKVDETAETAETAEKVDETK